MRGQIGTYYVIHMVMTINNINSAYTGCFAVLRQGFCTSVLLIVCCSDPVCVCVIWRSHTPHTEMGVATPDNYPYGAVL